MKLTKNWHSNKSSPKTKRVGSKPKKISLQLLGIPGRADEKKSNSIDEVRRQAVLMSSGGFRDAIHSSPSTPTAKAKAKGGMERQKPRRAAIK